ncbi:acetamidase/formamidase family protein [Anaerosphaera multitolerans]|uniref:Formamidase n=1 Tax=Anaerosphaera multitolerans TaxID=2487351 RepID=A0A437S682_9FIRM|nr:acetamidase/formamidase family protein [Anaerosphaera multitolerans]RVU54504.1 formamidase [Anaerosphaera multitolerans]
MQKLLRDNVIYNFENGMKGAYKVKDGETFTVETCDCFHQQISSEDQVLLEIDMDIVNPATGPIYVEGAEVGDILKVEILDIKIDDRGVAAAIPGSGGLPEESKEAIVRVIEVKEGFANYLGKKIPIEPMIGVIGVAPGEGEGTWGTHTPWKHGGNMDTKTITKGRTLYFDVGQEGAMLALGDLHAVMGDGELCFTGLEIPGEVDLKVSLIKGKKKLNWPVLESKDNIAIIASGENLEEAMQNAASTAVKYISEVLNSTWAEAYVMASQVLDLRISQVVNPMKTVRAEIPNYILTMEEILNRN